MEQQYRKVKKYLSLVRDQRWTNITSISNIGIYPCDYKTDNTLPDPSLFRPFGKDEIWGEGLDTHAWFHFTVPTVTTDNTFLYVKTEYEGRDDAKNPQFIVYLNGRLIQGLDINHMEVSLEKGVAYDVYLYGYVGMRHPKAHLFADVRRLDEDIDGLYYDLLFPFESLAFLPKEGDDYAQTLYHLWRAVSMLSLYNLHSEDFLASVRAARSYMAEEFYQKCCHEQPNTTICIGHTHIDCAWLWTLKQTREKVQRSFGTALALMRRYPEYKFMSSQPFLYQNLKEEAPELYEEIKERIREGRWECEGAMWVEADCNLTSGESLVRQVLYGKRFFKEEFDVDSHVLWLPDVFGYSAALPQILRKSGVDWFVTSKISWNDVDRMPYDTFLWRGIDGSEIRTHFITAQNDKGGASERYTTYVCNTHAPMVSGTYKRYSQKQIHNEAIMTFGFGDGGGGPTSEHLELLRRASQGIPGLPNAKIDFAGKYLERLAKKMEEKNDILPRWCGELYLEFHRGTYTTMSRNKRNNRKSEFLYQNAELYGAIAKVLTDFHFPAPAMRRGWEMILTNQFHDIIPGSSIKAVYDQSDIDYAAVSKIGNAALQDAQASIAAGIDSSHGYVVFNPNSQGGRVMVTVDGKTVYADGIAPKGYTACGQFVQSNHVRIDGQTVETDCYLVTFDDAWQMISLFDKRQEREILREGCVGNELRVYADYPDTYDAWEWQSFSRESYSTLCALSAVNVVEDGIRRGIRLIRPHLSSTVTQTIWFYDCEERIDFETVVDWHEHHQMLKAAFPVTIHADRATYEIQFGAVERPTHFNTSWDQAKFEVCAQKYADISEGNYGVAILNDCKYGHDIHDGVIQLSLLRSPTDPNPEADQGKISFTYAICPHNGDLYHSSVLTDAYALNNPATALPATGHADVLPLSLCAVSTDCPNVICETVKPAEDDCGTVLRLYEAQNMRSVATLSLSIPASHVFACDMLENRLYEIPVTDGHFTYTFTPFEIATFLVEA